MAHIETIARGIIIHNAHILVCGPTNQSYCYLPGGHVEFGEPAAKALQRELIEEAQQPIEVGPLLLTEEHWFAPKAKAGKASKKTKIENHEINLVFAAWLTNPMFHVEHSKPGAVKSVSKSATKPTMPPAVVSCEDHIEFRWLTVSALAKSNLVPTTTLTWVQKLVKSGLTTTVGLAPTDAPTANWLSQP